MAVVCRSAVLVSCFKLTLSLLSILFKNSLVFHQKSIAFYTYEIYHSKLQRKSCTPFLENTGPYFRYDWGTSPKTRGELPLSCTKIFTMPRRQSIIYRALMSADDIWSCCTTNLPSFNVAPKQVNKRKSWRNYDDKSRPKRRCLPRARINCIETT